MWEAVAGALQRPDVLAQEYQRRRSQSKAPDGLEEAREKQIDLVLRRVKAQEDRLMDAYTNEAIELPRLKEDMGKLKARRELLQKERRELDRLREEHVREEDALVRLEAFCERVSRGLENLSFEEKQKLLRLLVDRIEVDGQQVRIEAVIPLPEQTPEVALCLNRPVD